MLVIFLLHTLAWTASGIHQDVNYTLSGEPLLLTPYIDRGDIKQARELSAVDMRSLYKGTSHAGFITADRRLGNHLFFWHFPSPGTPDAPLVVWLEGGPTASSMKGLFSLNGPIKAVELFPKLFRRVVSIPRETTWVDSFSMLYIDNPVTAGFSFTDSGKDGRKFTQEGYTEDLYSFIRQFYVMFPEYRHRELYIGGQSYAGKYAPALGKRIAVGNDEEGAGLPLAGVYLGGPLFDPPSQTPESFNFLFNIGAITNAQNEENQRKVRTLLAEFDAGIIPPLMEQIGVLFGPNIGLSTYDNFVSVAPADYTFQSLLENVKVKKALHVGNRNWTKMSPFVEEFAGDLLRSTKGDMAYLLDRGYKVIISNGNLDLIVSTPMVEAALLSMDWAGRAEYRAASRSNWMSPEGTSLGWFTKTGPLCRVVVQGAGHQMPDDEPLKVLQMMRDFVTSGCINETAGVYETKLALDTIIPY